MKAENTHKHRLPSLGNYVGICLVFSVVVNLLMLVSPLYMLQIYDRVMTSGSTDALIWLSVMAVGLLSVYAAAEAGRRRVLSIAGADLSERLSEAVFDNFLEDGSGNSKLSHSLSLASRIQNTVQSGMPTAICDLPFAPFFLLFLFVLHPVLGVLGCIGVVLIVCVAIISELQSRKAGKASSEEDVNARQFAQGLERQRSAIASMGIGNAAKSKWIEMSDKALSASVEAASIDGAYAGISRTLRQILQVLALGIGAALALNQHISAGGIVAASILMGRALAPIDQIVGGWRTIVRTRTAWVELKPMVNQLAMERSAPTALPRPEALLTVQSLAVRVPGAENDLIRSFSHMIKPGEITAIVGSNGCGKTTLLQILAGAWNPVSGVVRLGGRDVHDWPSADRGQYVGYLPQHVELLPGTVRENIVRLGTAPDEAIFRAANLVGAHEEILKLPQGYDTVVGPGGQHLSAGQAQMIGLARAFFNKPAAIILDEPSANLDHIRTIQLANGLKKLAQSPACIVLTTHDLRLLRVADTILIIRDGAVMSAPAQDYLRAQHAGISPPNKERGI